MQKVETNSDIYNNLHDFNAIQHRIPVATFDSFREINDTKVLDIYLSADIHVHTHTHTCTDTSVTQTHTTWPQIDTHTYTPRQGGMGTRICQQR